MPPLPRPDLDALRTLAAAQGLVPEGDELRELASQVDSLLAGLDAVEALPEPPRPAVPDRPHRRAAPEANPFGAWVWQTSVREREEGGLAGRRIVLKDNIALAGVPMGGGTDFLADFVPEEDATVVRRILEEGGEIVGKAACEYLSLSAGSHTSATGVVRNPRDPSRTTGGSSSGCAALVAAGEVDLALGGDQGGSIRLPASFTGIVGMKPTHGLVPYTGILSLDAHIDHTGPMTATVADNALLLEVIAGPDGLDPRQLTSHPGGYVKAVGTGPQGLRVGVLEDGFGPVTEPGVADAVRAAGERLASRGATLASVSVPEHGPIALAALPFLVFGGYALMRDDGIPCHGPQRVPFGLPEAFARWRNAESRIPFGQRTMFLGGAVADACGAQSLYAKGLRLRAAARDAYDRALGEVDALLLPTTPHPAPPLPAEDGSREEWAAAASAGIANTSQFDVSGHPAVSVPCGELEGLPVGAMLVGRHGDEATLYRLAGAIEGSQGAS